jgi:hypothetical protein
MCVPPGRGELLSGFLFHAKSAEERRRKGVVEEYYNIGGGF